LIFNAACASAPVSGRLMPTVTSLSAAKARTAYEPTSAAAGNWMISDRRDSMVRISLFKSGVMTLGGSCAASFAPPA